MKKLNHIANYNDIDISYCGVPGRHVSLKFYLDARKIHFDWYIDEKICQDCKEALKGEYAIDLLNFI